MLVPGRRRRRRGVPSPIGNAWSSAFDQGDLQAENDALREENDRLQGEVSAGQVSQEQLQQLLENEGITFTGDIPRAHAQVVAGSVGNFGTTIDLDKGSTSGIAVDMAVVTGKGLIGKVVQVSDEPLHRRAHHQRQLQRRLQRGGHPGGRRGPGHRVDRACCGASTSTSR